MNEDPHRIMADAARAEAVRQPKQIRFTTAFSPFASGTSSADRPNRSSRAGRGCNKP
jgi:hypothetical protein